jgi:SnoaL-like domain
MDNEVLAELAAREAIRQQLHNYCRAMDRRDDRLGYAVWHEDGTADYGAGVFQGRGRDFVGQVSRNHLKRTVHSHQIATVGIAVTGCRAVSEAYVTVRLRTATASGFIEEFYAGRYLDRWSRRDGRWAIDHRIWVLDFDDADRPVSTRLPSQSSRDESDPSYAVFAALRTDASAPIESRL